MFSRTSLIAIAATVGLAAAVGVAATNAQDANRDNIIDGTRYPDGYTPVAIKDGKYPRVYHPNTELLGPKEMRVTLLIGCRICAKCKTSM